MKYCLISRKQRACLNWCSYLLFSVKQNSINVLSANCQGLRNYDKGPDILTHLKICQLIFYAYKIGICSRLISWLWKGETFISASKTNFIGVALLLNNNFEFQVISSEIDNNGNCINIVLQIDTITLNGPNSDSPTFIIQSKIPCRACGQ